jgi:hypothetical protein
MSGVVRECCFQDTGLVASNRRLRRRWERCPKSYTKKAQRNGWSLGCILDPYYWSPGKEMELSTCTVLKVSLYQLFRAD